MSFNTSLTGLKAAQSDLSTISNNVANVGSNGFKKSVAAFGDLFASSPTQSTQQIAGLGTHLQSIKQQFTQGTLTSTGKTLDLAIAGEGMFIVKGDPPRSETSYTRNGAFSPDKDGNVLDATGQKLQVLPVDASGNVTGTGLGDLTTLQLPASKPGDPTVALANISIGQDGLVTATYADGTSGMLGKVAMASFPSEDGLKPIGDAHWQSTGNSGPPMINSAENGPLGSIHSGALESANVDVTEELVALIGAQRNFQANAKALETEGTIMSSIINLRV
ncbi:flagellar hook-basal body complex protein (plasmid) [Sphingomonas paeninsulae]|uniref:Flagellar hook protein FlgE n=1 Tax=Sphingomonas paeninsulae TaxID=2319844 RepID=A0A494TD76_SPHPE|nr:flagellar hook-basal body complex protein [Sphingomonas paeninsulae]AYJ85214.1 flagellar hook-basal body complex protein [Sphingomonas paeninsulae]